MNDNRSLPRWLRIAGRVGASALTLAVLVAGVGFSATGAPAQLVRTLSGPVDDRVVRDVVLTPPDRQLVCAGPALGFVPQDTIARGFGTPEERIVGNNVVQRPADSPDVFNDQGLTAETLASPLTIVEQESLEAGVAAATRHDVSAATLRGMATAACLPAQFETWIAAGSTDTGRQGVLSLTNPGSVPATVDIAVYGEMGAVDSPGAQGILLPPGTRRTFTLTGFAPGVSSPVLHITASGSAVAAALHVSVTRGLDADGVAIVTGQFGAEPTVVIPALFIDGRDGALERRQQPGFGDLAPALRLLAPTESTTAQIRILRPGATDVLSDVRLSAGQVVDIAVDELGSGVFSVVIEADQPIVAGARVSLVGESATDVSWVSAQPVIDQATYVALPPGPDATLAAVAGSESVTLTLSRLSPDGLSILDQRTVTVPPGTSITQALGAGGGGFLIEPSGPVVIGTVLTREAGLGHIGIAPLAPELPPVSVIVR